MALEIFRLDGRRVAQEPLKDNNTLDILSSASTSESEYYAMEAKNPPSYKMQLLVKR